MMGYAPWIETVKLASATVGTVSVPDPAIRPVARPAPRPRPTGWPTALQMIVHAALLTLMLATTHYLVGDPVVSAARWIMYALLCATLLFRPRGAVSIRKPRLLDAAALSLIVLAAASALYSGDPSLTVQRSFSLALLYVAVFWTMWAYADFAGDLRVANTLLRVAAIVFLAGVANVLLTDTGTIASRYRGVLVNPNAVGMLAVIFLPLAIAKWVRERSVRMTALTALIVASVILSGSRNGVLAASVGIVFMLFRVRAWRSALLIGTLGTAIYLSMSDSPVNVGRAAESLGRLVSGQSLALAGGRVEAWEVALPIIRQKLALGHGFGTEETIFKGMIFRIHRGQYVHNSYLGLTYQLGLAGSLLLFTPLLWLLFRRGFARRRPSIQTAAYEAILFGGLVASFFESWIYSAGNAFAFPFWICVMLLTRIVLGAPETPDLWKSRRLVTTPHRFQGFVTQPKAGIRRFEPPVAQAGS